ncbi:hypothetical protein V6N13_097634 [Hibiscus sabdariffa]
MPQQWKNLETYAIVGPDAAESTPKTTKSNEVSEDDPEEFHNVDVIDAELEKYWRDHYLTTESKSKYIE